MATYRKRGDRWQVQVRRLGFAPLSQTFSTKALAEVWAKRMELDIERGIAGLGRRQPTLREMLERWRDEVAPLRRGERWDVIRINRFLDTCKSRVLDLQCNDNNLPHELRLWRDERMAVVTGSTVSREMSQISGAFQHAIKEGWIDGLVVNPVRLIKRPADNKPRTQRCSDEQLTAVVGPVPTEKPETVRQYLGYMAWLAVETAMRLGEIVQLQWKNLNVQRRTLSIEDTWEAGVGGKKVKIGEGREIPLSKRAITILQTLADHYEEADWEDRMFPISSGTATTEWRRMTKTAQLSEIHFHDLRREATTRMSKKLGPADLAKITGHKNLNMILNVYFKPDVSELAAMLD